MDLLHLEEAAHVVLSPPNEVSVQKRNEAEVVFLQMRKLSKPYSFCETVLESSCSHYVKFQAVLTLKDAILREWLILANKEKDLIRQYLWDYALKQTCLPQYILQHISVLMAVLIKRSSLEQEGNEKINNYIYSISHLFSNSSSIELGCSLLSSLLMEFSSSSGSSCIGMPLDFHVKCKKVIEINGILLEIFSLVIQTLECAITSTDLNIKNLSCLLSLSLEILSWDFRSPYIYNLKQLRSSTNYCTPLQPPTSFHTILFNPALLHLFFRMFVLFYEEVDLSHTVNLCLSQLASLSGPIFSSEESSKAYLENFFRNFLTVLASSEKFSDRVLYGVSCIFRQLASAFSRSLYSLLDVELRKVLVETLVDYCVLCAQRIATYESAQSDASLIEESFCYLLEVVVRLLEGPADELSNHLKLSIVRLVNGYFSCKMNIPQGIKQYHSGNTLSLDLDDDDRDIYADELSYVGTVFRYVPQISLSTILGLFLQCFSRVLDLSQLFSSSPESVSLVYELESIYENIHWLLLITTFTLTDVTEDEEGAIPTVLLEELRNYHHDESLSFTIEELVNADCTSSSVLFSIDPIVALIVCLCKWSCIEKQYIENGLKELISPQVCETAIWSLCTVLSSYLLTSVKESKVSPMLRELVVNNSESSKQLLCFTLKRIMHTITIWHAEDKLVTTCVKGLSCLARFNKLRASYLCTADDVWLLMKMFVNWENPFTRMSSSLQRFTITGFLNCARGSKRELFVNELLKPLSQRFEIISRLHVSSNEETRQQLLILLESLTGVAQASHNEIIHCVFPVLLPILNACIVLFELYCGHQDILCAILSLFCHVSENFIIFLDDDDTQKLYEVFSRLGHVYTKFYINKYITNQEIDDEKQEGLLIFIQTLSHLTTKDYVNLKSAESIALTEVVLKGFSVVLPVINEELLKFSDFCKHFYELLHYICDIFPEDFVNLPTELLDSAFKFIMLGLTQFGSDIALMCVECIESVSSCFSSKSDLLIHYNVIFLNELLLRLFNHFFEGDLLSSIAGAIYQLMCSVKDIVNLTDILLPTLSNNRTEIVKQILNETVSNSLMSGSRIHKKEFIRKFLDILPNLQCHFADYQCA